MRLAFRLPRRPEAAWLGGAVLLLPAVAFVLMLFLVPALNLLADGFLTQNARGVTGFPLTLGHYAHFFGTALYSHVLVTTLRISLLTAVFAAILGYPVALVIARGGAAISRAVTIITIAPLIVSVVVRTYGWQLILANNKMGLLNVVLAALGLIQAPLRLLYSETAVIIGSLHVFLPMMVLPLASALGRIDPSLEDAARTLGAPAWRVFRRVTIPLSLPGLTVGFTLVFSLTAGSFVTPAILGGTSAQMLGNLIEQQIMVVYDWPFGAAIACVLVAIVLGVNVVTMRALERRHAA
jgi:putative spermidine/putrescine transport system permease protein